MTNVSIDFARATDFSLTTLADLFTRAFEGYLVPVFVTAENLAERVRSEHIDLFASRVAVREGVGVGLALVARRGRRSRLGAMGVTRAARGTRVGKGLLDLVVQEATARGDRTLCLEVFEANAGALELYRRSGFRTARRLVGYDDRGIEAEARPILDLDPDAFGRAMAGDPGLDLPWQLSPDTLAFACTRTRVVTLDGHAWVNLVPSTEGVLTIRGIYTEPNWRRRGCARALLHSVRAAYPGRAIHVPALVPEGAGEAFFRALGFVTSWEAQLEMTRDL
jgi:ribosomal protein S18 acetylase RimI-like enzyme